MIFNITIKILIIRCQMEISGVRYNPFLVYCRELAPGTVSLIGDRAQGDDSKHDSHYNAKFTSILRFIYLHFCTSNTLKQ